MTGESGLYLDWSVVVGGGFGVTVLMLALVERLRRVFATKQDLNGLGQKFNAIETLYIQVRESADDARAGVAAVRAENRALAERITDQVVRPLERLTLKMEELNETQVRQAATLEHLDRLLSSDRETRSGSLHQRRRRP
ncbi:MAG TPA: hypothetical protein VF613_18720 [Longimicrobium sp.]|jgi:hypothetical protein